ncbi:M48 family metallopeptidase [Thioflexithrix psekupsensis]|uniref:Peptidase M48 domain-containing protein n=1 Tax=Thioflexithrix psekupsensis TaxID=1570016 RepID=A0A251X8J6_9GAMM|nr:M48 family metallopeptidase [Thioflexithrix psekupsensis]OUD14388.1 hypothetical protein TPSD3_08730 [Thioflexithrix psekupsensis]
MDFFHHQDQARKQTRLLLFYFILAIVAIVVILNFSFFLLLSQFIFIESFQVWLYHPIIIWLNIALIGIMLGATGWRMYQLAQDVDALAYLLGAIEIPPDALRPEERRLLNVVEEISIASGIPVPSVYLLDHEYGINAFVSGYRATETILVVTRGLLEKLNREELQGVIGHEFSHILNGDTRLNLHLVGLLSGILVIGQLGFFLFTNGTYQHRREHFQQLTGGEYLKNLQVSPLMLPPALILITMGYLGLFIGRIIKAAISQQREFLADASAVQFIRNRQGLINALLKIKNDKIGAKLFNFHTEAISHMCFAQSLVTHFSKITATHPPLEARVIRLDLTYKYRFKWQKQKEKQQAIIDPRTVPPFPEAAYLQNNQFNAQAARHLTAQIGKPTPEHLHYAAELYQRLPDELLAQARHKETAQQLIYALLCQGKISDRKKKQQVLQDKTNANTLEAVIKLMPLIQSFGIEGRLPLIDLAIPALKRLSYPERKYFLEIIDAVIKADGRFSLFEFVLATIIHQHLPVLSAPRIKPLSTLEPVLTEAIIFLALLAHVGGGETAYQAGLSILTSQTISPPHLAHYSARQLQTALRRLQALNPLLKKQVVTAYATCVLSDGQVRPREMEVLRAITEALDCPMPPLLL